MKKFYICSIEVNVVGKRKTFFGKKEHLVGATTYIEKEVIYEENKEKEIAKILCDNYRKTLQEKINKNKKVEILDYSDSLYCFETFQEILYIDILNSNIREATIEECIEKLTPTEYSEIYGNKLIIKTGEDFENEFI